jgi:hypothetical protein
VRDRTVRLGRRLSVLQPLLGLSLGHGWPADFVMVHVAREVHGPERNAGPERRKTAHGLSSTPRWRRR